MPRLKPRPIVARRTAAPTFSPFLSQITLADAVADQPRQSWVQLFQTGKYWDTRYGNFAITPTDLSQIAANFGTPALVPVDYNHGTSRPVSPEAGKAAGKIVAVEIRASGQQLWGQVEWTEQAAAMIDAKEYQAMSPTFQYGYKHSDGREMGTTLLAAALTNRPVLDGMAEIAAGVWMGGPGALQLADSPADLPAEGSPAEEAVEQIFSYDEQRRRVQAALAERYALGTPDIYGPCCGVYLLDLYDGRAIFRVWRESADGAAFQVTYEISADGAVTFTSEPAEVVATWTPLASATAQETAMSKDAKTVTTKDAKGADVTLSAETVAALVAAHAPAPAQVIDLAKFAELQASVTSQGETITQLSQRNAALELAAKTADANAKVKTLIDAGKALPVERDELVELALSNGPLFEKLTAKRPKLVDLGHAIGSDGDRPSTGSNAELDLAVTAELTANPKLTKEQAYAAALEKNPKLYELASAQ